MVELNSVTLMKNDNGDNRKFQLLQIPLEQHMEKKIVTNEILGDNDGGLVLSIDLKVIQNNLMKWLKLKWLLKVCRFF